MLTPLTLLTLLWTVDAVDTVDTVDAVDVDTVDTADTAVHGTRPCQKALQAASSPISITRKKAHNTGLSYSRQVFRENSKHVLITSRFSYSIKLNRVSFFPDEII